MAEESKLQQTVGSFKVIGKVTRIDKDGAYKEEQATNGKHIGETYRSLRFGVKTSETNEITVQMFSYEPNEVFLWNSEKKKKDPNYKGEKIPFATWEEQEEHLREQGYTPLQTRVGVTYDEKGKLITKGMPSFMASEKIFNHLNNGDSVVVKGSIRYSQYKNRNDELVEQKSFNIEEIYKIKDVDFEDEKFEEVTYFEQEMVFVDLDIDKKEGKAYLTGRVIDYFKNFHDTQMVINFKNTEGKIDNDMVGLVDNIKKKIKFGDVITVYGDTLNRVIVKEVEEPEEKVDLFAQFGGKNKPKHAESYTARTYVNEMSVFGISGWEEKVYTEDDFVKDELVEQAQENPFKNEFGGKGKKDTNPFDSSNLIEISEDDLPF